MTRGDKKLKKGFYEKAIACYKKSYQLNDNYVDAYSNCAYCLAQLGPKHYEESRQLCKKALEIDSENPYAKRTLERLDDDANNSKFTANNYGGNINRRTGNNDYASNSRNSHASFFPTNSKNRERDEKRDNFSLRNNREQKY